MTVPNTITGPNWFGELINMTLQERFDGIPLGDFYYDPSSTCCAD